MEWATPCLLTTTTKSACHVVFIATAVYMYPVSVQNMIMIDRGSSLTNVCTQQLDHQPLLVVVLTAYSTMAITIQ